MAMTYRRMAQILLANGVDNPRALEEVGQYVLVLSIRPPPLDCPSGSVQDMQVSWEPSTLKLGEMIGFYTYGNFPTPPTSITFNQSTSLAGFDLEFSGPCMIHFPNLISIDPLNTQGGYLSAYGSTSLILDLPLLSYIAGSLSASGITSLILNLPLLSYIGGNVDAYGSTSLILDLPLLSYIGGNVDASGSTFLSLDLNSWLPTDATAIDFSGCNLTSSMVEMVLRRCVLAGVTSCVINLSGGTNAGTASLNAQGQADVVTLGGQLAINP